jgi:hypothetical protein
MTRIKPAIDGFRAIKDRCAILTEKKYLMYHILCFAWFQYNVHTYVGKNRKLGYSLNFFRTSSYGA